MKRWRFNLCKSERMSRVTMEDPPRVTTASIPKGAMRSPHRVTAADVPKGETTGPSQGGSSRHPKGAMRGPPRVTAAASSLGSGGGVPVSSQGSVHLLWRDVYKKSLIEY